MEEWRKFERMVASIERALAPYGAIVKSPDHIPDVISLNLREVDASIRFQVGSTPILITVECRRRSASQDVTWIEQLVSKKENIGANATIAVSSTGFSAGALDMAKRKGIETRTLTDVTGGEAASWVKTISLVIEFQEWTFQKISVRTEKQTDAALAANFCDKQIAEHNYDAVMAYRRSDRNPLFLGEMGKAFIDANDFPIVGGMTGLGDITFGDEVFFVPTEAGDVPVLGFYIEVKIVSTERPTPLVQAFEYGSTVGVPLRWAEFVFHGPSKTEVSFLVSPKPPESLDI